MQRKPVISSSLSSVGYESSSLLLEIEFKGGGIYTYSGVSASIYAAFMSSSSLGSFFHRYIKDKYPCTKLK